MGWEGWVGDSLGRDERVGYEIEKSDVQEGGGEGEVIG